MFAENGDTQLLGESRNHRHGNTVIAGLILGHETPAPYSLLDPALPPRASQKDKVAALDAVLVEHGIGALDTQHSQVHGLPCAAHAQSVGLPA